MIPRSLFGLSVLLLWGVLHAAAALAAPTTQHPWLHLGPPDRDVPRLDSPWLQLEDLRRERLMEEGHAVVHLHQGFYVTLDVDGIARERIVLARRFLTPEGVRNQGNIQIRVRTALEELYIDEAYVVLPDGQVHQQDLGSVQVVTEYDPDVFSDVALVVLPFDRLEPGATAVLAVRRVGNLAEWPLPWSSIYVPRDTFPIASYEVTVSWDPTRAPPEYATDSSHLSCSRNDVLRCTARDIPPMPGPESIRSWEDLLPHLVVSVPHDWAELAERARSLVDAQIERSEGLEREAARLIDGVSDPRQRLERLHRFVADEIRYVSFSHGVSAVRPRVPHETLARRLGDCKDKVTLLLALARHAGLEAYPVLVGTSRHVLDKLLRPSWRYFDHMIACFEIEDQMICVDPTSPHAPTGVLPGGVLDAVALDLRKGVAAPHVISAPPHEWEIEIEVDNVLSCDGGIEETLVLRFHSVGAVVIRGTLTPLAEAAREQWARDSYQEVMGDRVVPTRLAFDGLHDVARPVEVKSITTWPKASPLAGSTDYREMDAWLVRYGQSFGSANRNYPHFVEGTKIVSRVTYRICPEVRVRFVGAALDMRGEFGELRRSYSREPGVLQVKTVLELRRRDVDVGDLDRFRRFLGSALDQAGIWFSLVDSNAVERRSQ